MALLWVDKYQPRSTTELIGQNRNVARIKSWLKTFDPSASRPLFLYGPPGIGKTTAAHLCCKETGYKTIEFNASDQRNKGIIQDVISTIASNSRLNFFGRASETKDAIILDEVDGLAGNEDRGAIPQLIIEIKKAKKPMIFICNDGQHQKLRSLKDKCETIEFKRPDLSAIKTVVTKISKIERLNVDKINVNNLAEASDYDLRQIINSLSLFRDGKAEQLVKTTRLNAFEATKKALSNKLTLEERFDCFFADYNIMPLFMLENYLKMSDQKGDGFKKLKTISRCADSFCLADLADKEIRSNQNWSLLNAQALFSTVIPSRYASSSSIGRIDFPQFLGKLSNANKRLRLTQELNAHMCLSLRGGLDADYLDAFRERLSAPLLKKQALGGIDSIIDLMHDYSLTREDFNSIMELASWSFLTDPMTKVDTKTKTAFTLAFKKSAKPLPYFTEDMQRKKTYRQDSSDGEEEDEEEVAIKPKRVIKAKESNPKKRVKTESSKTQKTDPSKNQKTDTGKTQKTDTSKTQKTDHSKAQKMDSSKTQKTTLLTFFESRAPVLHKAN